MTDFSEAENDLLLESGKAGGEYLDSIGISDLASLSKEQWLQFLQCVVGRMNEIQPSHDAQMQQTYEAEDPFGLKSLS